MPNFDTYSTRYYGDPYYGENTTTTQLWALEIDWDGDGIFDGSNDGLLMLNCNITRGRRYLINSSNSGFEPVEPGYLTVELDNSDNRYTPLNTSSPLYPYVRPGVSVRLRTKKESDGVLYSVFAGRINDIQPVSGSNPKRVRITVVDGNEWLKNQDVTIPLNENIGIDGALDLILTHAEYPWSRSIEASTDTIRWWWISSVSAKQGIQELIDVNLGTFFIAADGTAKFYSRSHYATEVATIGEPDIDKDITTRQPWEIIKNYITIIGHPRIRQATGTLWTLSDKPVIDAGQNLVFWASFSDPATGIITPVATTDYLVNTASDGSGTDLTASCTVVMETFAKSVKLTITNNSASNGYVTLMKIRGDLITAENPVQAVESDETSRALYGPKKFTLDSPWLQDTNFIVAMAKSLIQGLVNSQVYPTIRMVNKPDIQFLLDLFDIVSLTSDQLGINGSFQVGHIEHRWAADNGQVTETTIYLEPTSQLSTEVWQFTTQIGLTSRFGF